MDYIDKHKLLLQAQSTQPATMTIRQMGDVLDIESTSHVRYILDRLVEQGLAEKISRGVKNVYHIKVGMPYKHNEPKHGD